MAQHHVVTIGASEHEDEPTISIECSCGAFIDTGEGEFTVDHLNNLVLNLEHRSTQED